MIVFEPERVRHAITEAENRGIKPKGIMFSPGQFDAFKRWFSSQIRYPERTTTRMIYGLRIYLAAHLTHDALEVL